MSRHPTHQFSGAQAVVLHRSDDVRERLAARLRVLGVDVTGRRSALEPEDTGADFALIDVDQAHDEQFPWPRGQAPLPTVALIGSESPGRLAWALESRIDAFLPLGAVANIYSALVIAHATFEERRRRREHDAKIARRAGQRLDVIRAVVRIMEEKGLDEAGALKQLRALSMVERVSLEDAAGRYLAENPARRSMRQ